MDGYKRPFRGSKIYVHKKDDEDKTLVNLYKESEYAKEDTPKKSRKNKDADTSSEDIDDFINTSNNTDEEDIPVKKSIKKERKKRYNIHENERTLLEVLSIDSGANMRYIYCE